MKKEKAVEFVRDETKNEMGIDKLYISGILHYSMIMKNIISNAINEIMNGIKMKMKVN